MSLPTTVLLVANEPELLDALAFTLNQRGYRVIAARSVDGAIALAEIQLPDVAVVDMLLPGQSGFQLTLRLKEQSNGQTAVVMISDHMAAAHQDYAFAAGVDQFLEKWLAPARLLALVESLCPLPAEPAIAKATAASA